MTDRASLFPADIIEAAQASQRITGCPACVTLAQWAEESGFGKYLSAPFNFFGIKYAKGCPYPAREHMTKEWTGDQYVTKTALFIAFPSAKDAFIYHGRLIMNPRGPYGAAIPYRKDWRVFIAKIAPIYATAPQYGAHLIDLVDQYRLDEFNLPQG